MKIRLIVTEKVGRLPFIKSNEIYFMCFCDGIVNKFYYRDFRNDDRKSLKENVELNVLIHHRLKHRFEI